MTTCASCGKEINGVAHIDCRMQLTCDECWGDKSVIFSTIEGYPTGSHWSWNTKMMGKPIITIDYDHTITNACGACKVDGDRLAQIQPGTVEAITELSKTFTIKIFTGRRSVLQKIEIEEKLKSWGIPFDEVLLDKPQACFMIDDRAVHHKSWTVTMEEIRGRLR